MALSQLVHYKNAGGGLVVEWGSLGGLNIPKTNIFQNKRISFYQEHTNIGAPCQYCAFITAFMSSLELMLSFYNLFLNC